MSVFEPSKTACISRSVGLHLASRWFMKLVALVNGIIQLSGGFADSPSGCFLAIIKKGTSYNERKISNQRVNVKLLYAKKYWCLLWKVEKVQSSLVRKIAYLKKEQSEGITALNSDDGIDHWCFQHMIANVLRSFRQCKSKYPGDLC